jgi:hypothetical protein
MIIILMSFGISLLAAEVYVLAFPTIFAGLDFISVNYPVLLLLLVTFLYFICICLYGIFRLRGLIKIFG